MKTLNQHISHVKTLHSLNEFITERLVINKSFKSIDDIDDLIDKYLYPTFDMNSHLPMAARQKHNFEFSCILAHVITKRYMSKEDIKTTRDVISDIFSCEDLYSMTYSSDKLYNKAEEAKFVYDKIMKSLNESIVDIVFENGDYKVLYKKTDKYIICIWGLCTKDPKISMMVGVR